MLLDSFVGPAWPVSLISKWILTHFITYCREVQGPPNPFSSPAVQPMRSLVGTVTDPRSNSQYDIVISRDRSSKFDGITILLTEGRLNEMSRTVPAASANSKPTKATSRESIERIQRAHESGPNIKRLVIYWQRSTTMAVSHYVACTSQSTRGARGCQNSCYQHGCCYARSCVSDPAHV